ncbi:TolB protein-related protein [Tanacetum coccineum]
MSTPKGTIIFTTIGRPQYGFDVFSTHLPRNLDEISSSPLTETRLTNGESVNFNAQFVGPDDDKCRLVYISERTGSPKIYLDSDPLPCAPTSLFHDRPIIKDGHLYFISAHEKSDQPFKSWSALYTVDLNSVKHDTAVTRLTTYGCVDYSPSVSRSGELIAVASYGSRPWGGEFHHLETDIVVFRKSDPANRYVICSRGGWPTWSGDDTIYFHRQSEDGWWSIFRLDLPENLDTPPPAPTRITPPGVHCFTPAAMSFQRVAVATRRKDNDYRHIEIFDIESKTFYPVTKHSNPNIHHYNPFVSPDSGFVGYHRFRGESSDGESIIPHLSPVLSPIKGLRMLRLNGAFPAVSPAGELIAFNPDLGSNAGVDVVKSDGSKRWTLFKGRTSFCNSWSPTEKNVIFTSIGPIFESVKKTVQIARVSFSLEDDLKPEIKVLTKEETGNNAFPSCSPDGKHLVFRSGRSGHKNLYILDAVEGEFKEEGGIRQVTNGPWIDTMPSWSPDGKLIAFSSNRHNPTNTEVFSIYIMCPDGSDVRRIYVAGEEGSNEVDRERINHVCFSADGEWLLFTANIGGVIADPVSLPNQFQPYGDLYVARLDGTERKRLTWNGYENGTPAWHPGVESEMGSVCLDGVGDRNAGKPMSQFNPNTGDVVKFGIGTKNDSGVASKPCQHALCHITSETVNTEKTQIQLDHPIVSAIGNCAINAFNDLCKEEGILGVYEATIACDPVDGRGSVVKFILTDQKPTDALYELNLFPFAH